MSAWITEQHMGRSGLITEQTVAVELDPDEVMALIGDLSEVTELPARYVSITVKFQQLTDGTGIVRDYRPNTARAYVTVGPPR